MNAPTPPEAWPFHGYEKIAEGPDKWLLDEGAYRQLRRVSWVVTEKIHGANFCFVTDGATIRCAKRKAFLEPDDEFFGYRAVLARLADAVKATFQAVAQAHPGTYRVGIYGELYGGAYPHPEVPPVPGLQAVQTGVYYAPGLEFCAFDLSIEEDQQGSPRRYLDYLEAQALCAGARLPFARDLFVGKYEEAVAFPIGFDSHVPGWHGLPALPRNRAEGVVVKPVPPLTVQGEKGPLRPVVKRKIPEFAEERFHQAEKGEAQKRPAGAEAVLPYLRMEASGRLTENRLDSAVSKTGRLPPNDAQKLAALRELVVDDVLVALLDDHRALMAALTPEELAALTVQVREEAAILIELYPERVR